MTAQLTNPSERGNALVEFLAATFLLLVPLVYLVFMFFSVQAASFAAEGAARDAGRILAAARDEARGFASAEYAAVSAFEDFGLTTVGTPELTISCSENPCLTPGGSIHVRVRSSVTLPLIPLPVAETLGASVAVEADAVVIVDRFVDR